MKILNVLLFIAVCAVVVGIGIQADAPNSKTSADPNPMKVNQEQFDRIEPSYYANSSK
jgi:hypothetical protein